VNNRIFVIYTGVDTMRHRARRTNGGARRVKRISTDKMWSEIPGRTQWTVRSGEIWR